MLGRQLREGRCHRTATIQPNILHRDCRDRGICPEPNIVATLSWNATGDDANAGTASSYEIRFTTSPTNFESATLAPNPPVPKPAGSQETFVISSGLSPGIKTWFAIKTRDDAGNSSVTVISATMPVP
jgi:hypothetical protein